MPDRMSRHHRLAFLGRFILAVVAGLLAVGNARAGGSISLGDAMHNFDAPPALVEELEKAVREAKVTRDDVICGATRFGRHWTKLGGGRASPYECTIGKKTLVITGRHEFRDASGRVLAPDSPGLNANAASVRDVDITWEWK
ncbi:MAG: hypothetical protein AB7U75_19645 [Hyphomicrobiaceae bacterium]